MKINRMIWIFLMTILLAGISYGSISDVNIIAPASSSVVNASLTVINITFTPQNGTVACQLQATSTSTANSSGYNLFNMTNMSTQPQGQVNTTIDLSTIAFEDSNDYILTASCQNNTEASIGSDTNTGVTFNSTVPLTPISSSASETKFDNGDVLTVTVGANSTTGCTIYFDNQAPITMTHSGATCTYTFDKSTLPDRIYNTVYIKASDGTETTNSANYKYIVENNRNTNNPLSGVNQAVITEVGAQQLGISTSTNQMLMYAFILAIVWYVFFYNKK